MYMEYSESVIICSKNRLDDLIRCLDSLVSQTKSPQELIIVDSSDMPLLQKTLFTKIFNTDYFPITHLIYVHTTPGLTHQRNIGVKHAKGEIIYFFDDDVVLESDYL